MTAGLGQQEQVPSSGVSPGGVGVGVGGLGLARGGNGAGRRAWHCLFVCAVRGISWVYSLSILDILKSNSRSLGRVRAIWGRWGPCSPVGEESWMGGPGDFLWQGEGRLA